MATVTGLTAERMLEIEASSVVEGEINPDGHLILSTRGGEEIDAGSALIPFDSMKALLLDFLYPVGTVYMSVADTSPETLFGGDWVAWGSGRVPVGVDEADSDFNAVEKTGGSKTHTLTAAQSGLPAHNHTQNAHTHTQNAHTHTQNSHSHEQYVTANSGGPATRLDWSGDNSGNIYPQGIFGGGATATNNNTTAVNNNTTATNNPNTAQNASQAHNIQQKFITCYMWKRVG